LSRADPPEILRGFTNSLSAERRRRRRSEGGMERVRSPLKENHPRSNYGTRELFKGIRRDGEGGSAPEWTRWRVG